MSVDQLEEIGSAASSEQRTMMSIAKPSAYYALGLLTTVNLLNYIDRNLPSILAESIKHDLHLTDTQLGFLIGTAFATLFAVVGIPMGRITDQVSRRGLMAVALVVWSSMTALSGLATSFAMLAFSRVLVGLGEASANPCSHALLSDIFPRRNRAVTLSTYLAASYGGAALSLIIGGFIVTRWSEVCTLAPSMLCGIRPWQAAFFIVGLPGIALALLVARMPVPPQPAPPRRDWFRVACHEFAASVPPFTLFSLASAGGVRAVKLNLWLLAAVLASATGLIWLTGDKIQWICVAIGTYSIGSWIQGLRWRDLALFKVTFGSRMFQLYLAGMALSCSVGGTATTWAAPYAIRQLRLPASKAGLTIGLTTAIVTTIGVLLGGWLTDRWKRHDIRAPIWVGLICMLGAMPGAALMYTTANQTQFFAGLLIQAGFSGSWSGGAGAFVQDLVEPRMRGTAAVCFSLVATLVLLAIGPYWAGRVSTATHSLGLGVLSIDVLAIPATILLVMAARRLMADHARAFR